MILLWGLTYLSSLCFAAPDFSVRGSFHLDADDMDGMIREGQMFHARIRYLPRDKRVEDYIASRVGKTLLENFFLVSVRGIQPHPNNADLVDIRLKLILKEALGQKDLVMLNIDHLIVPLELRGIKTVTLKSRERSFQIVKQDVEGSFGWGGMLFFFSAALLATLGILYRKYLIRDRERRNALKEEERMLFWKKKFYAAKDRDSYEEIYRERELWIGYFHERKAEVERFFRSLNAIQYKQTWTEEEKDGLESTFHGLRDGL